VTQLPVARTSRSPAGSVRRRPNGRWEGRYTIKDGTGRSRQVSLYGTTKQEVSRQLIAALAAKDRGVDLSRGRETVGAYMEGWLEGAKLTLRPRTWARYEALMRLYVVPQLGRLRLGDLRPAMLRAHYQRLLGGGTAPTKHPSTVHHVHRVFRKALADAVKENRIAANPAAGLGWKRPSAPEMKTLTADQVRRLLDNADEWDRCLFLVATSTGMRLGELQALRWADLDLEARTARVVRTLHELRRSGPVFGEPKTAHSRRRIELSDYQIQALREQRGRVVEGRLLAANLWDDYDLVFPSRLGTPRRGANVSRDLHAALARACLPRIRFHDLRHTAATLLLGRRDVNPKVVADMLGHADVGITLNLYSHSTPAMHRSAAEAMADLLGWNQRPSGGLVRIDAPPALGSHSVESGIVGTQD
jgi:integrase